MLIEQATQCYIVELKKRVPDDRFLNVLAKDRMMPGKREVDAELRRSLGLSMKEMQPLFAAGGDPAERKFMECCWCLWKANGVELVESFVEATFNKLPEKSRAVLFQRMLTIVYVAQDTEIKSAPEPATIRQPVEMAR
jgi:hypothetical protein